MRVVSKRNLNMILLKGSVRRMRSEVRHAIKDGCWVLVRLMAMGRMSTSMPDHWCRSGLACGV
jgi:hypothetical protein